MDEAVEEIVMTPTKKGKTTTIKIEKKLKTMIDQSKVAHKAGGEHRGLVINKQDQELADQALPPDLRLEFKCFLVDAKSGKHVPEQRILKFWFAPNTEYLDQVTRAYEFFSELVRRDSFPRDYVGFIKKVMKQMQHPKYTQIKKVDVDLQQLEPDTEGPPHSVGLPKEDKRPRELVVQESLLHTLESAYPNIMPMENLMEMTGGDVMMVNECLKILEGRNLIKEMEPGKWVRKVLDDKAEVKIVKQMPLQQGGDKPTVAIITFKYYEKMAVDAMMTNKTTFVKYKTEGESNVYTIGYIGNHKVVSTKLPAIGRNMAEQIASGNTTTRLLGTFGDVEHVFLVGCAGGVPHYTNYHKHVRLGDVIVAMPNQNGFMYIFCDKINHNPDLGQLQYTLKSWSPTSPIIQKIAENLKEHNLTDPSFAPWEEYLEEGRQALQGQEVNFERPPPETDRLFMNIGGNDVIEVGHPPVPEDEVGKVKCGVPVIRCGPIGAGKPVLKEDALRLDFAARHQCIAFDTEFDQVLESIVGNRKDSFAFIRGICDYLDGTKNTDWQPYSALVAASFMKAIIENLPPPDN
ncbi:hypothetical protein LSH36_151g00044 [Paralvinella palmiformis]|uniref:Winged helix-turn-helix domain-containing protein n=1 Tax=Paralvinella palmiformis TaxID=53620 RepID=A0AAD9JVD8_9ANNE|nr:hypothetical protein LSH36_151g00044 [Paralvinella palmiformis]